jgi:hypothetical protein
MRIARVFPRKTKATPDDELAFVGDPPGLFPPEVDAVHISVAFTWDLPEAERLAKQWEPIAPVTIGGPATGMRGEGFEPGMYLKHGYVITSRGCRNRCWFCSVWKREGDIRELPIMGGWNVLDDNLLATSREHFNAVDDMLNSYQLETLDSPRIAYTGGLEAALLTEYHALTFFMQKPKTMFFAYDTPSDKEPLYEAGKLLFKIGFKPSAHILRAYVLIGYPEDTFAKAELRLRQTIQFGFLPMAMIYRDEKGYLDPDWVKFRSAWFSPQTIYRKMKELSPQIGSNKC